MRKLSLTFVVVVLAFCVEAQSPHGKNFKIDCVQCHTSENWKVNGSTMKFNHASTDFVLIGQHQLTDCKSCHKTLDFKDSRRNCAECHLDIHTSSLGKDCARCHSPKAWIIENITEMHQRSRFPLLGSHRTVICSECHKSSSKLQFDPLSIECVNCHLVNYQNTTSPNHVTGKYSTDCIECHDRAATNWKAGIVNHDFFPLIGGHAIGCGLCHPGGHYAKVNSSCNFCHQKDFTASLSPNHTTAGISTDCSKCHTIQAWKPSSFNHTSTGYELKGAHKNLIQCSDCHKGNLTSAQQTCVACHQAKYNTAPNHKTLNFSTDCVACHTQNNWLENSFDHAKTNFPLTGLHVTAKCTDCHITTLKGTSAVCSSCHLTVYTSSQLPQHVAAGIPKECAPCHTTNSWKPSLFNHTTTGFTLLGAHKNIVQCSECHKGNLTSAQATCISCHQTNYNAAPNHKQNNYPTNCAICHSQNNWLENSFNHALTNFPLTGAHLNAQCTACHTAGYTGTPKTCNSCHLSVYTSSQLPAHVAAGIPKTCETCHNTTAWKPSTFNHTSTGYQLLGAHTSIVQCSDCHKGNVSTTLKTCISCHQVQYNNAPGHVANNYPADCTQCHGQTNWLATSFDHKLTNFPLTGAHTSVLCTACHTNGYKGTPTTCNSCHLTKYNSAVTPNHLAAGISTTCSTCHNTTAWKPSTFNHTTTGYQLIGAHSTIVQCSDCHKGSTSIAPQTCIGCHQTAYNNAANHKAQGYPTDCTICHSQINWLQSTFNHATTKFPLTGAHISVLCASCHTTKFTGTPTDCYSCHTAKYNNSTNPNHLSANFPTTCQTCHTTTAWTPANYNHDAQYFPIYSGRHKGAWTLCSECHTTSNFAAFNCLLCHAHSNKTSVDNAHKGMKNYSYVSTVCYSCHPQGRAN